MFFAEEESSPPRYLPLDFLQMAYYSLGKISLAKDTAASFLEYRPGHERMRGNFVYFSRVGSAVYPLVWNYSFIYSTINYHYSPWIFGGVCFRSRGAPSKAESGEVRPPEEALRERVAFLEKQLNPDFDNEHKLWLCTQPESPALLELSVPPATDDCEEGEAMTLEVLSLSPRVFRIRNFLTPGECDQLIETAQASLRGSVIVNADGKDVVSKYRSSKETYLDAAMDGSLEERIERRMLRSVCVRPLHRLFLRWIQ